MPDNQKTDWKRFDAMTDEEIDKSEIQELGEEWFKSNSKGRSYQTFINAVLRHM